MAWFFFFSSGMSEYLGLGVMLTDLVTWTFCFPSARSFCIIRGTRYHCLGFFLPILVAEYYKLLWALAVVVVVVVVLVVWLFGCLVGFWRQSPMWSWPSWSPLCRPNWPPTHRDLPASTSQVLIGIKSKSHHTGFRRVF